MNRNLMLALVTLIGWQSAAPADSVMLDVGALSTPGVSWAPVLKDLEVIGAINREGDALYLELHYSWFELPRELSSELLHRFREKRHIARCWFNSEASTLELSIKDVPEGSEYVEYKERSRPDVSFVFLGAQGTPVEAEDSEVPMYLIDKIPERMLFTLHNFYPQREVKVIEPVKKPAADEKGLARMLVIVGAAVAMYLALVVGVRRTYSRG